MAGEWLEATLEDVCAVITDGAHFSPKDDPSGLPMASVKDLTRHGILLQGCRRISQADFDSLRRQGCSPKYGDVLIAKDGNSALDTVCVHQLREEVVLLSSVAILRPNDRVTSGFLRYYLDAPETRALLKSGFRSGSAIPRVVLKDFRRAPVVVPPIDEQRAIARILGTLDDKIELNRRINETLEAMARALFKSWFVDFDPVRAKAEGRDPGLPKPLADLFPDRLVDSEFGEIPEGWSATPLYDIATYINGAAYAAFQPNDERRGLPIIKIAELKAGVTSQTKFSDVQMSEKYRIASGDILFSWSGNPDTSIDTFVWSAGPAWLNQHIFRVLPLRPHERAFVLSTLKALRPVFAEIARNKQTTGLGHVTAHDMKRLLVARPDDRVMSAWSRLASPLHERTFQNALEIAHLSKVRDALLPKLISGELRVRAAEHLQHAAA